jgi:hypothetical protein
VAGLSHWARARSAANTVGDDSPIEATAATAGEGDQLRASAYTTAAASCLR